MLSVMTPAPENIRGTSALPYYILLGRDKKIEVELYSYNLNALSSSQILKTSKELNLKINLLPIPQWYNLIIKYFLFFRLFLKKPLGNYIRLRKSQFNTILKKDFDGIWIYGEELSQVSSQLAKFKRVHTLPDCESLYYYRMLGKRFAIYNKTRFWRSIFMYPKFLNMEKNFDTTSNIHYHLVGEKDVQFLKEISPNIQAHFIFHPHYQVAYPIKRISFSSKIKLLIAGQYNLYMQQDADELLNYLCKKEVSNNLKEHYIFTYLGEGWEKHVNLLSKAGYEVTHKKNVSNYVEEIIKYDIQITPICLGTGTKGKVLDAIANGLLVIGSWYAFENIAVENQISCLQYIRVCEIIKFLDQIYLDPLKYILIAEKGRQSVLKFHDHGAISKEVFRFFSDIL
jgi:hypothetical protein